MTEFQFWAFIAFLSFVVWPILYVVVDRHHIATWVPNRYESPDAKALRTTGKRLTQTQPRSQ